jgi:DNA polymerase III gamma/tau subunit
MSTPSFAFPQPLAEKHRPRTIADFIGLDRPKRIMASFASNPRSAAFLFTGPSGTGKTTMALALCEAIGGELIHIPS